MPREIKFRAWQTVTKTMFYNIEKGTGDSYNPNPPFADYLENMNMIIMQYTGLEDKKGQEIYEGDIIRFGLSNPNLDYIGVISYSFAEFTISSLSRKYPDIRLSEAVRKEVIGNIYEPPKFPGETTNGIHD